MVKAPRSKLITLPNTDLRKPSQKVRFFDKKLTQLVADMQAVVIDWEKTRQHEVGVALAAVQIDELVKVVIIREDFEDKENHNFQVLVNPEIIKLEGEISEDYEGCLSIKDIYGMVPRAAKVRVKAFDASGRAIRIKAEGFLARVLQHEIDHTNGVVFIDHIKDRPEAFYELQGDGKLTPLDYEKDIRRNSLLW